MSSGIWSATLSTARTEFTMQLRRKSVWIAPIATSILIFSWMGRPWMFDHTLPASVTIGNWAIMCNRFLPVVFGVLLADRLPRDRRLQVTEMLDSLPASAGSRLAGKFSGSALATATPIFLIYLLGVASIFARVHDPLFIPMAPLAFLAINLPGLLFIAAFSIAVPSVLWVPLYQFLFVGYWFWGNLLSPEYGIPTLSNTLLTPLGNVAASGLFSTRAGQIVTITGERVSGWEEGALSIVLLLVVGAGALLTAHGYLSWQRAHE